MAVGSHVIYKEYLILKKKKTIRTEGLLGTVGTRGKFIVIYNIKLQTATPIGLTVK